MQATAVARRAGDDVVAGIAGEAGLQTVGAWKRPQESVVATEPPLADMHGGHRPIAGVLRVFGDHGARDLGEIARRRQLVRVREGRWY